MKKLFIIIAVLFTLGTLSAKEPTNWMIGVGGGYGMTSLDIKHSFAMQNPLHNRDYSKPNWEGTDAWPIHTNRSLSSWSGAWEILFGYKHFVNDYIGVRTYANVGVQHYKPSLFESKLDPIGLIDYSLNADILLNFYENEKFSIGILAGLGMGGTSFAADAISKYLVIYDRDTGLPSGTVDVKKHFLNINGNVGVRLTFFQKLRDVKNRKCEDSYTNGKRLCNVPVSYVGHSFEVNGKFNALPYNATKQPDIVSINGKISSKPQYTVKNPYRITLRYIIDF